MIGRLDPQKAFDVFLSAAIQMQSDSVVFEMAGASGPFKDYQSRIEAQAREAGIAMMDGEGRGVEIMRSFDIVVIPSRWEGSPVTLFEALALGKPVIGSDIPGIREVLHDIQAPLVPPDDSEALSAAIRGLLHDRTERMRLREAARAFASTQTEEAMARRASAVVTKIGTEARTSSSTPKSV